MARIVFTALAVFDVDCLLSNLAARASLSIALKYEALLEALYARLGHHPESGAPRPTLGKDVRIGIVAPFVVVYRYSKASDAVAVPRVLDGRQRITWTSLANAEHDG